MKANKNDLHESGRPLTQEEFINKIKTDDEFAKKWGDLGPVHNKQWRSWGGKDDSYVIPATWNLDLTLQKPKELIKRWIKGTDQIANLIRDLKTNPDSKPLLVSAWNVGELDQQISPIYDYSFQVYTRELSYEERETLLLEIDDTFRTSTTQEVKLVLDEYNIPTRVISLMWNQRSVDTFLCLPKKIASYGLLLEIIAKAVNMVPDELIANMGDCHIYSNHVEQAMEQIGRALSIEERIDLASKKYDNFDIMDFGIPFTCTHEDIDKFYPVERRTREPYPLPTLNINTEFWPYEGGECGVGPLDAVKVFEAFKDENFCRCLMQEDIQLSNYQYHPEIK